MPQNTLYQSFFTGQDPQVWSIPILKPRHHRNAKFDGSLTPYIINSSLEKLSRLQKDPLFEQYRASQSNRSQLKKTESLEESISSNSKSLKTEENKNKECLDYLNGLVLTRSRSEGSLKSKWKAVTLLDLMTQSTDKCINELNLVSSILMTMIKNELQIPNYRNIRAENILIFSQESTPLTFEKQDQQRIPSLKAQKDENQGESLSLILSMLQCPDNFVRHQITQLLKNFLRKEFQHMSLRVIKNNLTEPKLEEFLQNNKPIIRTNPFQGSLQKIQKNVQFCHSQEKWVNAIDEEGNNPLMIAIKQNQISVVQYFLENTKIDPNHKNQQNETAFTMALKEGYSEICNILIEQGKANLEQYNWKSFDKETLKGIAINLSNPSSSTSLLKLLPYIYDHLPKGYKNDLLKLLLTGSKKSALEPCDDLIRLFQNRDIKQSPYLKKNLMEHVVTLERIGQGGQGLIERVFDKLKREFFALKKNQFQKMSLFIHEINIISYLQKTVFKEHFIKLEGIDLDYKDAVDISILMEHCVGSFHDYNDFRFQTKSFRFSLKYLQNQFALLLRQICLHNLVGIAHADVKAGNFVISKEGKVKMIDYGISEFLFENHKQSIAYKGTTGYIPPELERSGSLEVDRVDAFFLDLYSLGVLMQKMLTKIEETKKYEDLEEIQRFKKQIQSLTDQDPGSRIQYDGLLKLVIQILGVGEYEMSQILETFFGEDSPKNSHKLAILSHYLEQKMKEIEREFADEFQKELPNFTKYLYNQYIYNETSISNRYDMMQKYIDLELYEKLEVRFYFENYFIKKDQKQDEILQRKFNLVNDIYNFHKKSLSLEDLDSRLNTIKDSTELADIEVTLRYLSMKGELQKLNGDFKEALKSYQEGLKKGQMYDFCFKQQITNFLFEISKIQLLSMGNQDEVAKLLNQMEEILMNDKSIQPDIYILKGMIEFEASNLQNSYDWMEFAFQSLTSKGQYYTKKTAFVLGYGAKILLIQGKIDLAEEVLNKSCDINSKLGYDDTIQMLDKQILAAQIWQAKGDYSMASQNLELSAQRIKDTLGNDHYQTGILSLQNAFLEYQIKEFNEAELSFTIAKKLLSKGQAEPVEFCYFKQLHYFEQLLKLELEKDFIPNLNQKDQTLQAATVLSNFTGKNPAKQKARAQAIVAARFGLFHKFSLGNSKLQNLIKGKKMIESPNIQAKEDDNSQKFQMDFGLKELQKFLEDSQKQKSQCEDVFIKFLCELRRGNYKGFEFENSQMGLKMSDRKAFQKIFEVGKVKASEYEIVSMMYKILSQLFLRIGKPYFYPAKNFEEFLLEAKVGDQELTVADFLDLLPEVGTVLKNKFELQASLLKIVKAFSRQDPRCRITNSMIKYLKEYSEKDKVHPL